MLKLIRGEIYRMLHKKSMYIYFASLAAGYFLLAFIRSGGFKAESVVNDAVSLFSFLPALAGGFLFSAIYADDLGSKNLITLVGFGVSKARIVMAKLILTLLFGSVAFALAPPYHCAVYALLGQAVTESAMASVYAVALQYLLTTIAFSVLSGIAAYGSQRATFAIVLYFLLAFNVVGSLLAVTLRTFAPGLAGYLISGIAARILMGVIGGGAIIPPVFEYVIYVAAAAALSVAAFHKKQMEF